MILALLSACAPATEPVAVETPTWCAGAEEPVRPVATPLPLPESEGDGRLRVERLSGETVAWGGWPERETDVDPTLAEWGWLSTDPWQGPPLDWLEQTLSSVRLSVTAVDAPLDMLVELLRAAGLTDPGAQEGVGT